MGAGNWRMPRRLELASIIDAGTYAPAIDATAFPSTKLDSFWSASPLLGDGGTAAWAVDFGQGSINFAPRPSNYSVRCVH